MEPVKKSPAAITGIGLVTVLGQSADETFSALLAGRSISDHSKIPGHSGPLRILPMAHRAAAEALSHAAWTPSLCRDPETALIVGTSKSTIESWITPPTSSSPAPGTPGEGRGGGSSLYCSTVYRSTLSRSAGLNKIDNSNQSEFLGLSQLAEFLAQKFHFGPGPRLTLSSACSSGLHALARAALAIESGEARRALVVAADASVHPLFISSFKRLGILAPEGHGCRPFDLNRAGFIISEAAAALCLESLDHATAPPLVKIAAWSLASDAAHLTGCDPHALALKKMLHRLTPPDLDLIHAHATGTHLNDPVELSALSTLPFNSPPILYSHKAALGHSLGAAGLLSAVINCLCHTHGKVPANPRSPNPLPTPTLRFPREPLNHPIRKSLALAAGFAGPLAAVLFTT
jgi:3-oxoacyl-[acyl-carrier-protein] synthase II